jgi:5-methylcytosine-specific restriction protein B
MARTSTSTLPNHDPNVWVIRAGQGGDAHELFLKQNVIALSDAGLGNLHKLRDNREAFYDAYSSLHPDAARMSITGVAGKFYRFAYEVIVGDIIVYPSLADSQVHLGVVTGRYRFSECNDADYPHQRSVTWQCAIPKLSLPEPVRREMGAARTFFRIKRHGSIFLGYARATNDSN